MSLAFKDLPEVRAALMPTLILVRHGETPFDGRPGRPDKIQGWLPGGLSSRGKDQAHKMAKTLLPFPIRKVYSSDLPRAKESAALLECGSPGLLQMLRPWGLGSWQGSVKASHEAELLDLQLKHPDTKAPKGESFRTFTSRWLRALRAMLLEAMDTPEKGFIVAVTHSWNLKVAVAWNITGVENDKLDAEVVKQEPPPPGDALIFTLSRDGETWKISHLKA